ncbi:MAG: peptidoglycan DD-metalloendopeptidase family protein [Chloroflexota bacterium]
MANQLKTNADGIPISDGLDYPVGPRGAEVDVFKTYKIDTELVDPAYFKSFGVWHPGEDWNGRGGGDSDLGDPIYAISNGRVAELGYFPPSWGNIVLIEHALPDGTKFWSQYAHLERMFVTQGQTIKRGDRIGTMGKGAKTDKYPQGRWIAHLHFEIRKRKLRAANWLPMMRNKDEVLNNYYQPKEFIAAHRPDQMTQPLKASPTPKRVEPLHVIVDSEKEDRVSGVFMKADQEHWYSAPYGYYNSMLWTYAGAYREENWAEWRPFLPEEGDWQVWAYIPPMHATTTRAIYKISYIGGQVRVALNQSQYNGKWAYLGTYPFGPGQGYIRLTDFTGEQPTDGTPPMVGFDAISWTKTS